MLTSAPSFPRAVVCPALGEASCVRSRRRWGHSHEVPNGWVSLQMSPELVLGLAQVPADLGVVKAKPAGGRPQAQALVGDGIHHRLKVIVKAEPVKPFETFLF